MKSKVSSAFSTLVFRYGSSFCQCRLNRYEIWTLKNVSITYWTLKVDNEVIIVLMLAKKFYVMMMILMWLMLLTHWMTYLCAFYVIHPRYDSNWKTTPIEGEMQLIVYNTASMHGLLQFSSCYMRIWCFYILMYLKILVTGWSHMKLARSR